MEDTRHSSANVLTARFPAVQHKDECLTTDMPEPWFDTLRVPQELVLYSTSLHYARLSELCFTRAELRLLLLKSRYPLCLKPHVCDSSFHSGLRNSLGCAPTLHLTNAERPTQNSSLQAIAAIPPCPQDRHGHETTSMTTRTRPLSHRSFLDAFAVETRFCAGHQRALCRTR